MSHTGVGRRGKRCPRREGTCCPALVSQPPSGPPLPFAPLPCPTPRDEAGRVSRQGCKMGLQRQSPLRLRCQDGPEAAATSAANEQQLCQVQSGRMLLSVGRFSEEKMDPGSRPGHCSFPAPTFLWQRVRSAPRRHRNDGQSICCPPRRLSALASVALCQPRVSASVSPALSHQGGRLSPAHATKD